VKEKNMNFDASSLMSGFEDVPVVHETPESYEKPNPLKTKSFAFAIACARLGMILCKDRTTYFAGNQLLRSSSSVAANVEEANGASSPKDFVAKLYISLKEARESHFWIRYCNNLDLVHDEHSRRLSNEATEIIRLINAITKTTKERYPK